MGQIDHEDDDRPVHERHMRHQLAIHLVEDRLGLDARHDPVSCHSEGHGDRPESIAFEQAVEVMFDDVDRTVGVLATHAEEVLETEASSVDHQRQRGPQFDSTIGPVAPKELLYELAERFGSHEWNAHPCAS